MIYKSEFLAECSAVETLTSKYANIWGSDLKSLPLETYKRVWASHAEDVFNLHSLRLRGAMTALHQGVYDHVTDNNMGLFLGTTSLQVCLDMQNVFERMMVLLLKSSNKLQEDVSKSIEKSIGCLERFIDPKTQEESCVQQLKDYKRYLSNYQPKSMKSIKSLLMENGLLTVDQNKILSQAWRIRNQKHANYRATSDMKFSIAGRTYVFKKGEDIGTEMDFPLIVATEIAEIGKSVVHAIESDKRYELSYASNGY